MTEAKDNNITQKVKDSAIGSRSNIAASTLSSKSFAAFGFWSFSAIYTTFSSSSS